jgi:hypothetical protein
MIDPDSVAPAESTAQQSQLSQEPQEPLAAQALSESDLAIARVLEDLIDVLILRGVIQFTDLPEAAQSKLLSRRQTRAMLKNSLQLLPSEGEGGLL